MKVEIFCCRLPHYYGIGFTPRNAFRNAIANGGKQDDVDDGKYLMHRLPERITEVWVNDMGGLEWSFPEGTSETIVKEPAVRLFLDVPNDAWVEIEQSPLPKLPKFLVKVKIEGYVMVRAANKEDANELPLGMSLEDLGASLESSNDFEVDVIKVHR